MYLKLLMLVKLKKKNKNISAEKRNNEEWMYVFDKV